MKVKFIAATVLVMAIGITGASAQRVIHRHAAHQQARIAQGVKSGELTKGETKHLENKEKAVHQEVKIAKADGKITNAERKDIRQDQRQTSRAIYREKHNGRVKH